MTSSVKPAIIYLIKCKDPNIPVSYVGSTLDYKARISVHKTDFKTSNRPLYIAMRMNGGLDNFQSSILSVIPNWTSATQYREVERSFINILKPTMNKNVPNRTCREYQKQHPHLQKIYNATYKAKYPERIRKSIKNWQMKNKEKVLETAKKHYQKNRTLINALANQKIGCICGCISNYSHIKYGKHQHSKKHNMYANKNLQDTKDSLKSNPLNINPLL